MLRRRDAITAGRQPESQTLERFNTVMEVIELSESEAKQYVLDSIEQCREALSTLDSAGNSSLDKHRKGIEEVVELLEGLKEKVFLKTKKAMTPAYLVLEASRTVADHVEEMADADEDALREFSDAVNHLKDKTTTLQGASKSHSVIIT